MKIKTWLLITYLLSMLLPLAALYALYVSINDYYQEKNVKEYIEQWNKVSGLKIQLEDASLYEQKQHYKKIDALTNEQTMITLYSQNGRILYTSNPLGHHRNYEAKDILYKQLFEFKQNYETFVYKAPVYKDGTIVGIYKIILARTEWTEQVNMKVATVAIALFIFMLLLYGSVIYFLNKRLNKPLKQLMQQMRAFAKGQKTELIKVKNDELGELSLSFQQMQHEILTAREKIDKEQRQKEFMIASLSHDLKTPLTSIQAYAESLHSGKLSPTEQQEYLEVVQAKANYMKQLFDDLMMFALLQSPSYELELVRVEGDEFFDMLLGDYEKISTEKGFKAATYVNISRNYSVNPKQLMRVLDNLLSNAWTYTNPGGTVLLAAFEAPDIPKWCITGVQQRATKQGAYIVVQNSGSTISEVQYTQMFEPLVQMDESRSHIGQRGAGLGLSIAKQIIEKQNGTIQAISQQNETAILIWLPEENAR